MPVYIVFTNHYDTPNWNSCTQAHQVINWAGTSRVEAESQFREAIDKRAKGDWVECWLWVGQDSQEVFFA